MRVKKFEARTMQEALEMVKTELGPQAIILNAKDNNRRFGLVGDGSVEITAAISEESLKMKKFTESKMRDEDKAKMMRAPAKQQQQIIQKSVSNYIRENTAPPAKVARPVTSQRYIEIDDEGNAEMESESGVFGGYAQTMATQRIKGAAQRAWQAMQPSETAGNQTQNQTQNQTVVQSAPAPVNGIKEAEINALKGEIADLKMLIQQFKAVPQTFSSQHPGAEYGLPYELSFMFEKLSNAGIQSEYIGEILKDTLDNLPTLHMKKKSSVEAYVAKYILSHIQTAEDRPIAKVHLFLGASGHGKTSSLVKMAARMVVQDKKRVAILTTDTIKVGAAEQLKTYAQILNVPFAVIRSSEDWARVESQLNNFDYVLVDYPGFSLRSLEELNFMKGFQPPTSIKPDIHLVMSATAKDQDAFELGRRYDSLNYTDVIFTALDESAQHGVIYNFHRKFNRPLHSFGLGPRVPEDFEAASRERVLDLIFKITRLKSSTERE